MISCHTPDLTISRLGHRSTFIRQAANLWQYKQLVHQRLIQALGADQQDLYLMDGFPMPVCGFKRAPQARVFQGSASFGCSATQLGTFYGFRGHLLISAQGAVLGLAVTPANRDERDVLNSSWVLKECGSAIKGISAQV